jgi:3-keto-5-aminohexanoate cleavage enzyme
LTRVGFVAAEKVIIEVALNEQCSRDTNPHVPMTAEECAADALAAADAGAAVVHFHVRDPSTGRDLLDLDGYSDALCLINAERPDLLVRTPYHDHEDAAARFAHLEALADDPRTRLRAAMIDPGTVVFSSSEPATGEIVGGHVFTVSNEHLHHFLRLCEDRGLQVGLVVREPGHVRLVVAAHRAGWMRGPLLLQIHLSDRALWGVPPGDGAHEVYTSLVPDDIAFTYMSYTNGPRHWDMTRLALARGAHVRVGIGDHPIEDDGSTAINAEIVRRTVALAADAGREPATPEEALAILGGSAPPSPPPGGG